MQGHDDASQTAGRSVALRQGDKPDRRGVRQIASHELFAGAKEVIVEHEGDRYRLRRTSKGKLILTK